MVFSSAYAAVGGSEGTRLWGIGMLVVAVTAPILGAIADYSGGNGHYIF